MSLTTQLNFNGLYRKFRDRLFYRWVLFLFLGLIVLPSSSSAQFKFRQAPNRQQPDILSERVEQRLWMDFQSGRYLGEFSLAGTLKYRPARQASSLYDFRLNGNWNIKEQASELILSGSNHSSFEKKVVVRDGEVFLTHEKDNCTNETVVAGEELSVPLMEGLPFTWTDILMPYLKWVNVTYLGPDRYLGRPAHRFVLVNDNSEEAVSKVIVTLDEDYAVLLKSDVLDKDDNVVKRIRVSGFRQFNDEWMFSELVWEHRLTRESVLLKVGDFSLIP